jgi:hypothetical protein
MFATERSFGPDWSNHLWFLWVQGGQIRSGGPSLFLHADPLGLFYPQYAFYGGTLYALGGALSALLDGRAVVAYLATWVVVFASAYGGMLWLGLLAGLRGWRAHAGALVVVTSAYFLTNLYARGVWPESMASSALILSVAAGLHLLRAPRIAVAPGAAFVGELSSSRAVTTSRLSGERSRCWSC